MQTLQTFSLFVLSLCSATVLPQEEGTQNSAKALMDLLNGVSDTPAAWSQVREAFHIPTDDELTGESDMARFLQKIQATTKDVLDVGGESIDGLTERTRNNSIAGPEFRFIPQFLGKSKADGNTISWSASCFKSNKMTSRMSDSNTIEITIEVGQKSSFFCYDWYLLGTGSGIKFEKFILPGKKTLKWNIASSLTEAQLWDIQSNGIRVFRFLDDIPTSLYEIYKTAMLFIPGLLFSEIPEPTQEQNVAFMNNMVNINMTRRSTEIVEIDLSLVKPGDFFGVIRLDGLDPMLAWAMGGSHTGHTTLALQSPEGDMEICESTTNSVYWPTNGIQCTKIQTWIEQARKASYQVVWLPLSADARKSFNNSKAYEFFTTVKGLNYGFGNMFWGWIDFPEKNFPYPLTSETFSIIPSWFEMLGLSSLSKLFFTRAMNARLKTTGLNILEIYKEAASRNMSPGELFATEERDDYVYEQQANNGSTVTAQSMVCDVFVCEAWKAGGLFGDLADSFNCTEATNWDIYTLNIFDSSNRPQECRDADPNLEFCQLMGKFQLEIPFYNSRAPAPHMYASCPRGDWPDFNKPIGC
mmetsp:Transcript_17737/g.26571  ORF Transcript_17737/g.26571 Transcript_17737/m.26571 type:complete len:583 (+) Transcript_17737:136-1884(+)